MRKLFIAILLMAYWCVPLAAQNSGAITGKILSKETGDALPGASIVIRGNIAGALSDERGAFAIKNLNAGPIHLLISHVGYESKHMQVQVLLGATTTVVISLERSDMIADDIVISASRRLEKITDAPASVQVIGQKELRQFSGSNVGELAAYVTGVEFVRMGVDNVSFNARGLNNAFNGKVFQMVDYRNSMQPLSGSLMMGNNVSVNKEDIERVEILLGPQTALYGPNVHNALFNYITKDPRKYAGTTLAVSAGNQNQYSSRFRNAGKINDKWAYKITGEYATGKEFEFYDSVYVGGGPGGVFGPMLAIPERIDLNFRRLRGEGHIYYSLTPTRDLILSAGGSDNNTINTHTGGHNQFVGLTNSFVQARFVSRRFYATVYNAWADFGKSYSVIGYTRDFWNRTHSMQTTGPNARLYPEEAEDFARRNVFKETPQRFNAEAQYNYAFHRQQLFLVAGLSYQKDKPRGYGINLVDSFERIYITQYGAVLQAEKMLPWELRFIGAVRADHHSNFGAFYSPKLAITKHIGAGNLRVTWGRAYSMPSVLYQYARTGGLFFGNGEGVKYIPNGTKFSDPASIKITTPLLPEKVSTWEFGYKGTLGRKLFVDITYYNGLSENFFSPSISVGGRAISVGNKLVTHNPAFAGQVAEDTLKGANFSTIFNFGDVRVYGFDMGTTYEFNNMINLAVRYSWMDSDIKKGNPANDANRDGFVLADEKSLNSPRHRGVVMLNFQNIIQQKAFFSVSSRFVEKYDFYSGSQISTKAGEGQRGAVTGPNGLSYVKNFDWGPLGGTTVDVRGGYNLNQMASITFGITNLFDAKVREFAGSSYIRRLYQVELRLHVPDSREKK